MGKTVNLTVRVSLELKEQADAAADYLDTTLSRLVRDAFKDAITKASERALRDAGFKARFAELGVDAPTMTRKQEEDSKTLGVDVRGLSRQQRGSLKRAHRAGKLAAEKPKRSMKDDVIDSIRERVAKGEITEEEAEQRIMRLVDPNEL